MALSQITECVKIFFSLAPATEDRNLFERLRSHLSVMRLQGRINLWYDSEISPGSIARDIIRSHISTADIIVLLISADFFASDQCAGMEMPYALEQYVTRAAHVIPVLLRPIEWSGLPLEQHSPLPPNGKPVSTWKNLDSALQEVAKGIYQIAEDLRHRWTSTPRPAKSPQFPLSTLPLRRNPFFTDRDTTLTALHATFNAEQSRQPNIQALYGLGGIGKTLLAIEYADRKSVV